MTGSGEMKRRCAWHIGFPHYLGVVQIAVEFRQLFLASVKLVAAAYKCYFVLLLKWSVMLSMLIWGYFIFSHLLFYKFFRKKNGRFFAKITFSVCGYSVCHSHKYRDCFTVSIWGLLELKEQWIMQQNNADTVWTINTADQC
jgi:hypothetical protein